ncbi:MAG: hypothetical protein R3282_03745, partial [Rhodothermales bacterium]|nr:hypothetical protein [Rhodothermales bacterium]
MKRLMASATLLVLVALLTSGTAMAQLSGTFTVGGDSPDFASPQAAADSLMAQGITGPVEILIRPGVYEGQTDVDGPALFIDRPIAGTDRANRVVFRPDRSAGADTSNVILQRRIGGTVVEMATTFGIDGSPSHITLEGFAVIVKDTVAEVRNLEPVIRIAGQFRGVRVEDVKVLNMKIDGGGLAFKLAQALLRVEDRAPLFALRPTLREEDLFDLVAL